jgi:hypothetical protein
MAQGTCFSNPLSRPRYGAAVLNPKVIEVKALNRICRATYRHFIVLPPATSRRPFLQDALKDLLYDVIPAKGEKYFPRYSDAAHH